MKNFNKFSLFALQTTLWAMVLFITQSSQLSGQCVTNSPSSPVGIVPTQEVFPGGAPQCGTLGGFRVTPNDGPEVIVANLDGIPGNDITLTITSGSCGELLSWSVPANIVVDVVKAKGGTVQNIYDYTGQSPRPSTDGELHAPVNASGNYAGFSHIDICFHYQLSVSKTANAEFMRTYNWTIDKSCDGPGTLTLSAGQVYDYPFSWTAAATHTDSDWKVTGTVSIVNNTPFDVSVERISDVLSGGEAVAVDCGEALPVVIPSGGSLNCHYAVDLAAAYNGINTVEVTSGTDNVEDGSAEASFNFGAPTSETDECISVSDNCSQSIEICQSAAPFHSMYNCGISYDQCGDYAFTNTASFTTNDSNSAGSDDCSVTVNVPCGGGCTLTQGYWKSHSIYGPAPYDDTWALLGENNMFFLSGKTNYQTLWTAPAGNGYWILAHQYLAAQLNFLNDASIPPEVQSAFNQATTLFNTYTPAQVPGLPKAIKKLFNEIALVLDNYNNGLIGPGHCSEPLMRSDLKVQLPAAAMKDFAVTPNPAKDMIQLDLSDFLGQSIDLVLYNQLGGIVYKSHLDQVKSTVFGVNSLQQLPAGYYRLTLWYEGQAISKGVVLER